jgi:dipeptidyl-peptidase-4
VAFIVDNLFYQDLNSGKITQITQHGVKNKLNGLADWVYEEEFGHARQYEWTKNSDAIVFVKSDESQVPEIYIPIYGKRFIQAKCVTNIQKQEKKLCSFSTYLSVE